MPISINFENDKVFFRIMFVSPYELYSISMNGRPTSCFATGSFEFSIYITYTLISWNEYRLPVKYLFARDLTINPSNKLDKKKRIGSNIIQFNRSDVVLYLFVLLRNESPRKLVNSG